MKCLENEEFSRHLVTLNILYFYKFVKWKLSVYELIVNITELMTKKISEGTL